MSRLVRICLACPRGCRLHIRTVVGRETEVRGHLCMKGLSWGRQEAVEPRRLLTTTVATTSKHAPRLPVRTSGEVPLSQIFAYREAISRLRISGPCRPGDVLARNLLGSDVDLLATWELDGP